MLAIAARAKLTSTRAQGCEEPVAFKPGKCPERQVPPKVTMTLVDCSWNAALHAPYCIKLQHQGLRFNPKFNPNLP